MKYLMWDVDGTLILSGGAGKDAMIKVIKDYYFLDAFDFTKSLAGRTDSDIIKSVVTRLRGRCNSAEAAGLLIRYHMELPKQLPLHKGRVLKNVEKTLQYFCQPERNPEKPSPTRIAVTATACSPATPAPAPISSCSISVWTNILTMNTASSVKSAKTAKCWLRLPSTVCICKTSRPSPTSLFSSAIHLTTCAVPMPSAHPA